MKPSLLLLSALLGASAHAQPVYRCVNDLGQVAYGAFACATPATGPTAAVSDLAVGRRSNLWVAEGAAVERQSDAHRDQLEQQDLRAATTLKANLLRVRQLQKPTDALKVAAYSDSRRRCEKSLRIALLCGNGAADFFCDAKGFRPVPAAITDAPRAAGRLGNSLDMQRCTVQANRGG